MVAALWLFVASLLSPAGFADAASLDDSSGFYSRADDDLRNAEHVTVGQNAAPWLSRVLDILQVPRGPNYHVEQVALFDGAEGQLFLVVNWSYGEGPNRDHYQIMNILEFYRADVDEQGRVHLTTLREIRAWVVELVWPSGEEVFPGEPTVAVVKFVHGGSGHGASGYRLIQMKRNTVDITPDTFGRTHRFRDADDDGSFEVLVHESRWRDQFGTGGSSGPFVATILKRREGVFVPACREQASYYHNSIASREAWIAKENGWPYESLGGIIFDNLQIGNLDAAQAAYERLRIVTRPNHSQYVRSEADVIRDYFPVLEAAELLMDEQCILAAMTPDMMGESFFARPARYTFNNWLPWELEEAD